jgi:hypothetical protein
MAPRSVRILWLCFSALLIAVAAIGWLSFMAQGIAYGSLVGVPGRGRDLAELGRGAERALGLAATCEAVAIGIGSWIVIPIRNPKWARLSIAIVLAAIVDLFTLAVIKGT